MSRLPAITRDDLDEGTLGLYEQMVTLNVSLGGALLGRPLEDTAGPANAFLHAADLGPKAMALGAYVNTQSALPPRTKEIVVMTVAARWQAEFEWWAHERMAEGNQVDAAIVEAIARGDVPDLPDELDRTMWSVASQLATTGHVDDATYAAAEALVGREELVKVVALCGFYTLVAFVLNAFDVDVPEGESRRWSTPTPDPA